MTVGEVGGEGRGGTAIPWNGNGNGTGAERRKCGLYERSFLARYFLQRRLRRLRVLLRPFTVKDTMRCRDEIKRRTFVSYDH